MNERYYSCNPCPGAILQALAWLNYIPTRITRKNPPLFPLLPFTNHPRPKKPGPKNETFQTGSRIESKDNTRELANIMTGKTQEPFSSFPLLRQRRVFQRGAVRLER
jgi:hypothetical protein